MSRASPTTAAAIAFDDAMLKRAARLALRGHGGAEPNPLVGCVLCVGQNVIAEGYHRRCGEAHAEAMALQRAGGRARGATAYVTLEPCNHHGRTPPCSQALIDAGVVRVVYAQRDPNPIAVGGASRLRDAGIEVEERPHPACDLLNAPFVHRLRTQLPWVIAKWAQTIDGAIATRSGSSKWISCERSRRMVHRERGRVDVVMTGIGTAAADDPSLTARHGHLRRRSLRLLIDPLLAAPKSLRLLDPSLAPTIVGCLPDHVHGGPANGLRERGIDVAALGPRGEIRPLLAALARERGVSTVLVEAGGGLVGDLLREDLVQEAWIFVAPCTVGDSDARRPIRGDAPESIRDARRWRLLDHRVRNGDLVLRYHRLALPSSSSSSAPEASR